MAAMAKGRIRVVRAIPGPTGLGPLVAKFCRDGEGTITAFNETILPTLRDLSGDSDVEVVPFGQMVCRFLETSGEQYRMLATSGHQLAAVSHAMRALPQNSPFARSARFAGSHRLILQAIKELHAWGVDADEMDVLRPKCSASLASKLESLAVIDREVQETLGALGRETHDVHLRRCLEALRENDGTEQKLFVFIGAELHPMRLQWLKWAADQGVDITVVVDRHATDGQVFRNADIVCDLLNVKGDSRGDGNRLLRNLFSRLNHDGAGIDVSVVSAADPLAEVEWALRGCLEADDERTVGIYVRGLDTYAPLLESVAARLGVPLSLRRRAPLMTNAFARLTLTVLQFCASQDVRKLAPLLRSSYLGLSAAQQSLLASGLKESHGSRHLQWQSLYDWSHLHLEDFPWLPKVLEWRTKVLDSFEDLSGWIGRLVDLVHELPWYAGMETAGYDINRDTRAFTVLQASLANDASIEKVTEPHSISLNEFVQRCAVTWEAADVSLPPDEGRVAVSGDTSLLLGVDTLFVLGMLEGVFPKRRSEDPILTDRERQELSMLRPGHPAFLTSHDEAGTERDEFYRVCAAAGRRLVFSYPLADDQRDNIPAFYLAEVKAASGSSKEKNWPRSMLAPLEEDCLSGADILLRHALSEPREQIIAADLSTIEAKSTIQVELAQGFEPAELRDALQCAFQYTLRHRLNLPVKRRRERWSRLRQLPLKAGLVNRSNEADAEVALQVALEAELDVLFSEVPEWELQLLRSGGSRLIKEWVRREFVARDTWPRAEGSTKMLVKFGSEDLKDQMPGGLKLKGFVPAMSSIADSSAMHLYGSVKEPREMTDIDRLFYGLYFLAAHKANKDAALEIDNGNGKRSLLVISRDEVRSLGQKNEEGLKIYQLSEQEEPIFAKREFFESVKKSLREAILRIEKTDIRPTSGDHCDWCDYGELCRRSKQFGEDESPFGADVEDELG